jgi:2'-5' RNA ligase
MFVAVWPDDATLERLSELDLGPTEGLRPVLPGQWHITLRFLGDVGVGLVPTLVHALRTAATELPDSIHCEVGPSTAWFGGDRVLQIPVTGLNEVSEVVHRATLGVVPDAHHGSPTFTGHLTVARAGKHRLTVPVRTALAGIPFAASFEVESLDLVHSQLSTEGPRYTTRERIFLRG